ncbi:MAG: restriction endonuclease subunit S [Actinobacteria bacterium]|nr:restriction endonuclease subunit S [Actinomycetota bacterium]
MTDLPVRWAEARLDELADVRLGRQRSPKNHSGSRMRPYLRAANVTWKGLDLRDVKEMNFSEHESDVYELRLGDVLVAEASGSASEVGKPALWKGEIEGCCFQNTLVRVRSRGALLKYLHYFLLAEARSGRLGDAAPGVGIHHIGAARLSAWSVPVAPLNEQRRIVAAIEEQFSRLDAAEQLLRRATARTPPLRGAVYSVGTSGEWPTESLGELLREPLRNGHSAKASRTGDVRTLTLTAVTRGEFTDENTKLTGADPARIANLWLEPGDVLIERSNTPELVGTAALYRGGDRWAIFPDLLIRVRVAEKLLPEFLAIVLKSRPIRRYFQTSAQGIAGSMPKIDQGTVARVEVPVPPLEEQRRIVNEVEQQLSLIDAMHRAIEAAKRRSAALRRSILERAFRGELVPQDPADEPASAFLERIAAERAMALSSRRGNSA